MKDDVRVNTDLNPSEDLCKQKKPACTSLWSWGSYVCCGLGRGIGHAVIPLVPKEKDLGCLDPKCPTEKDSYCNPGWIGGNCRKDHH